VPKIYKKISGVQMEPLKKFDRLGKKCVNFKGMNLSFYSGTLSADPLAGSPGRKGVPAIAASRYEMLHCCINKTNYFKINRPVKNVH